MISKHRRLRGNYSADDYDLLVDMISDVDDVLVTPHTLAETSNLLGQHDEPERGDLLLMLRDMIHRSKEIVISGSEAADNPHFARLGLTDAGLLNRASRERPILTTDAVLYDIAIRMHPDAAVNFTHRRLLAD